jgi:hypothetical protein
VFVLALHSLRLTPRTCDQGRLLQHRKARRLQSLLFILGFSKRSHERKLVTTRKEVEPSS